MSLYMLAYKSESQQKCALIHKKDNQWQVSTFTHGDKQAVKTMCQFLTGAMAMAEAWTGAEGERYQEIARALGCQKEET